MTLTGLHCAGCAARAEGALRAVPGVEGASVNAATFRASVDGHAEPEALIKGLARLGYGVATDRMLEAGPPPASLALAFALALPVFVLEMGGHLFPAWHHLIGDTIGHWASRWVQFAMTAALIAGPGRRLFLRGAKTLWAGAPDMNALVALGAGAAFLYSTVVVLAPGLMPAGADNVYFESAAVIIALILLGRFLEARARGKAGAAIRALVALQPEEALVIAGAEGTPMSRPLAEIVAGDLLLARPGDRIAVDGAVEDGSGWVDEAMLTGEPEPVEKGPGAMVSAGTINGSTTLRYRATAVGEDTALARIVALVEDAQSQKLPIQSVVDRITLWFVPGIMALALVTVLAWLALGQGPAAALVAGVSVLIVACPCAMGLAVPVSILAGTGRGAERGILFRQGDALQRLATVEWVVFDKTGTLTEGRPEVTELLLATGATAREVAALAGGMGAGSDHPVAQAIASHFEATEPLAVEAIPGKGLRAGEAILGSAAMLEAEGADIPEGWRVARSFLAEDGVLRAGFVLSDPVREGAKAAMTDLSAEGRRLAMFTGDTAEAAHAIAHPLGIEEVRAGLLPEEKLAALEALDGAAAFVGDGINDGPALAAADVGIAIGTGTDVAIEAADVVLVRAELETVAGALRLSRAVMANIRQNLIWAFGYNVALIPLAAFGLLSPMLAALAMALSSLFVVGNALRLRHLS